MAEGMWAEARCQFFLATPNKYGENSCHETAAGAFTVTEATRQARRYGWKVIQGKWCCPVCAKEIANGNNKSKSVDRGSNQDQER